MGSGDEVPDALRRMGVDVTMIDREMLATGDLSRFDTIVVGVRASEARPDFVANQARLRPTWSAAARSSCSTSRPITSSASCRRSR